MRTTKDYILLYLKGIGMGGADIVPGVSGGTIAFITGIYQELLLSISAVNLEALNLLKAARFKDFWQHVNGTFLLVLLAGIVTSFLTLAKLLSYLLLQHPIKVWSFFFGLVIISAVLVMKEIKNWSIGVLIFSLLGIGIAYYISVASAAETPTASWFIFIAGAVAICAMILPGISGAFILLLFGKYEFVLNALKDLDFGVIAVFALGCITGLLSFARLVSWLLERYYNIAIGLLAGFMIGSLNKIWPWKTVTQYRIDSHGVQKPFLEESVLPTTYLEVTGQQPQVLWAILFMALGILLVVGLEKIAAYNVGPQKD
jgi:putative membrane protein